MLFDKFGRFHANIAALRGATKADRRKIRQDVLQKYRTNGNQSLFHYSESSIFARAQDFMVPVDLMTAKKIMVILVPEHNDMSGGIYSMFSIANQMRNLKKIHGYEVVVMTRPNVKGLTYIRNSNFRNMEDVLRFEQIKLFKNAEDIYIHLPEYASQYFVADLSRSESSYLRSRKHLHINILNQNIQLMPEKRDFQPLFGLTKSVTQSVAHHAYFSQEMADKYDLPTLLLPAYTDLGAYRGLDFADKDKLIIYSLDEADHKQACLDLIAKDFPDFELIEIRGITFDKYMDYATRCMFSISFGEGFDGYIAQPIYQGGIGLTVYNDEFFPSDDFKKYENFFSSEDDMLKNICDRMRDLMNDGNRYRTLNRKLIAEYDKLYSFDGYIEQLRKLALRSFEILPGASSQKAS